MTRSLALITALVIGCANDQAFHETTDAGAGDGAMIEVTPMTLNFGVVSDEAVIQTFLVKSIGNTDLEVSGIEISGQAAGSYTILSDEASFMLPTGTEKEIEVIFEPIGANVQAAQAIVSSNDELQPKVPVTLTGEGAIPELDISPDPLDFGNTYVGCSKDNWVTLTNVGTDDLVIESIDHTGGEFLMSNTITLPLSLAPGESESVFMEFYPELEGEVDAELIVVSNEPLGTRIATQTGEGKYAAEYEDYWEHPANSPSDIIFAIDKSCSMDDNQTALANNFSTFITQLSTYSNDWQVMVINDDANGCNTTGILTASTPNYVNTFQSAVNNPGKNSYTEKLLTPAASAVELTDGGECNAGFMRSNALLHIILVSDEPEQSSGNWSNYVNQIIAKKGDAANVRISSIVGDVPAGCNSGGQSATPGTGYYEATNYTGGVFLSICSNWASSSNLELLAEASVIQNTYALDNEAIEETVVVVVNNTEQSNGWYYDEASNSVIFETNVPEEGDSVTITYAAPATCD
ncbi:MAG: hypothetical protein ACI8RZ_005191 [Myxococcota bacterium]|jgi:hypothetical protein